MSTTLPPNCIETDSFLVELAYGEESAVPASAKQHLATCDRCQAELRALQGVREAAATLPMEEPSSQLDANIFAALDAHFAGESVDSHLTLPDPQPTATRPKMTVLQGGADGSPAPENRKTTPKRRRLWGPLAAAASLSVVAGSTWLVSREKSPEATFATAKQDSNAAPQAVADMRREQDAKNAPAKDQPAPDAPKPSDAFAAQKSADGELADKQVGGEKLEAKKVDKQLLMKAKDFAPSRTPALGSGGDMPPAENLAGNALGGISASAGASARGPAVEAKPMAPAVAGSVMAREPEMPAQPPPSPVAPMPMKTAPKALMKEESTAYRRDALAESDEAVTAAPAPVTTPLADSERVAQTKASEDSTRRETQRQAKRSAAATEEKRETTTLEEATVWKHRLNEGREALKRSDWKWAENQFGSVLQFKGVPATIRREALEGRITALGQLNRTAEAEAIAEVLSREFPSSATRSKAASAPADAAPAGKADTTSSGK